MTNKNIVLLILHVVYRTLLIQLKIGIGMEHMPFGEFEANAMYFIIGILKYNLMAAQKYFVVKERDIRAAL